MEEDEEASASQSVDAKSIDNPEEQQSNKDDDGPLFLKASKYDRSVALDSTNALVFDLLGSEISPVKNPPLLLSQTSMRSPRKEANGVDASPLLGKRTPS